MQLPEPLASSPWADRLTVAIAAVRGAAAALMQLRGTITGHDAEDGQLKTSTDLAAEGWVLGFLRGRYPDESMLAEEEFEGAGRPWVPTRRYWTIDALDGTRSYVDGYDGFCVQVAFVDDGQPVLGVIAEPVTGIVHAAVTGGGAWRLAQDGATRHVPTRQVALAPGLRFVDSVRPAGAVGALYDALGGQFVECGSVGLKIVRVVEGAGDVYAKQFRYKLWDVAPGEVLVREAGLVLASWQGERIDYAAARTHFASVLVTDAPIHGEVCKRLAASGA